MYVCINPAKFRGGEVAEGYPRLDKGGGVAIILTFLRNKKVYFLEFQRKLEKRLKRLTFKIVYAIKSPLFRISM